MQRTEEAFRVCAHLLRGLEVLGLAKNFVGVALLLPTHAVKLERTARGNRDEGACTTNDSKSLTALSRFFRHSGIIAIDSAMTSS